MEFKDNMTFEEQVGSQHKSFKNVQFSFVEPFSTIEDKDLCKLDPSFNCEDIAYQVAESDNSTFLNDTAVTYFKDILNNTNETMSIWYSNNSERFTEYKNYWNTTKFFKINDTLKVDSKEIGNFTFGLLKPEERSEEIKYHVGLGRSSLDGFTPFVKMLTE
jgi:hypothetical protein